MAHSATTRRQHILLLDTIVLGVVGALGAQIFVALLRVSQSLFLTHLAAYAPRPPVERGHARAGDRTALALAGSGRHDAGRAH